MKSFFAIALALAVSCAAISSAQAAYDFLTITGNNLGGNAAFSQFQSFNGNGVINVTHNYTAGSPVAMDNINAAIFPSQFEALFPGTGLVDGHLSQMNDNSIATVTFDMTGYRITPQTVFGVWNISDEGFGQPHYRLELVGPTNVAHAPTTLNLIGKQDNETQPSAQGRRRLDMDLSTGNLTATVLINPSGVHSNAAFWDNIPIHTTKMIVYGNLPDLATGDGVGYYFAEIHVPEPTCLVLSIAGLFCVAGFRRRDRR